MATAKLEMLLKKEEREQEVHDLVRGVIMSNYE